MDSIADQYRTIGRGAGWTGQGARDCLRFEGKDGISFLQALLTNDVGRIAVGEGIYAAYLTPNGRMIADIEVLNRGDHLLGLVPPGQGTALAGRFDQLIFSEAVTVTDASAEWTELLVTGGDAAAVLARALDLDAVQLVALPESSHLEWTSGFVVAGGPSSFPSWRIFVPAGEQHRVIQALETSGAIGLSEEAAVALRIEAGRALWGVDMTEQTIPLEAGLLERAISTSKGCYVGQEIVIRILHRAGGRVPKRLALLSIEAGGQPSPGTELLHDGKTSGHLTSVAPSPDGSGWIALGYVQRDAAETGSRFDLPASNGTATITGFAR